MLPTTTGRRTTFLLALALAGHVSITLAQDPLANIRQCAAESDDVRRLACYDREFRVLHAPAPTTAMSAEQRFGMNGHIERNNPAAQPPKLDKLTARVAAVWHKPYGEAVFRLENNQVWEEADGETPVTLKVGDAVTIDTGVMGAYYLLFGHSGSVRVKRTR